MDARRPECRGLILEADAARAVVFGKKIHRRYEHPLRFAEVYKKAENLWSAPLNNFPLVDTVVIE